MPQGTASKLPSCARREVSAIEADLRRLLGDLSRLSRCDDIAATVALEDALWALSRAGVAVGEARVAHLAEPPNHTAGVR